MDITIKELKHLNGKWNGEGLAEFPTIKSFDYHEHLSFSSNKKNPVLHFEQKAWIKSKDERNDEPISWESGFLIDRGDSFFEMVCTHNSGRLEILRGFAIWTSDQKIKIELESVSTINDDRMIRSKRIIMFSETIIAYEQLMSTTKNFSMQRHLSARLIKQQSTENL
jgi:hypothetical protein